MVRKLFLNNLYVKVTENSFEAKNVTLGGGWERIRSEVPFTTSRLLVGTFSAAEPILTKLVKKVVPKRFFPLRPQIVIHPIDKVEGGLSEVEDRIFRELALGSGAIKVVLHVGQELADSEVAELLK